MKQVTNNEARVHNIGLSGGGAIVLVPGVNLVDEADWEKAKESAIVQKYLSELRTESGAPILEEGTSSDVGSLSVDQAVALVKNTFDRDTLRSFQKRDRRVPVQDAIFDQLTAVDPSKKPDTTPTITDAGGSTNAVPGATGGTTTPAMPSGAEAGGGGAPDPKLQPGSKAKK